MRYVIYSHSDYSDILQIQSDYLQSNDTVLFIDKETEFTKNFDRIIIYDDAMPYASRVASCLNQLEPNEHFLFVHDIDIVISSNDALLDEIVNKMVLHDIGRVDLKIDKCDANAENPKVEIHHSSNSYLRLDTKSDYTYNVNPSIWRANDLLVAMTIDKSLGYREIELHSGIQRYCKDIRTHKLICEDHNIVRAGYYDCSDIFIYLHITHGGRLLPINDSITSYHGQSYSDVSEEYYAIASKYLRNSPRW